MSLLVNPINSNFQMCYKDAEPSRCHPALVYAVKGRLVAPALPALLSSCAGWVDCVVVLSFREAHSEASSFPSVRMLPLPRLDARQAAANATACRPCALAAIETWLQCRPQSYRAGTAVWSDHRPTYADDPDVQAHTGACRAPLRARSQGLS